MSKASQVNNSVTTGEEVKRLVMPGDVWRKKGPCDWVKVLGVQMPHDPNYDGGAKGCSVVFSKLNGNWRRTRFFIAAEDSSDFEKQMADSYRYKE